MTWQSYKENPPAAGTKFIVAHDDGCSSGIYIMTDDGPLDAEDGQNYGVNPEAIWIALPEDYIIYFMEISEDDWY